MNFYDIPGLSGYKSLLGSWGLILAGLGAMIGGIGAFLSGSSELSDVQGVVIGGFASFSMGLSQLGLAHKAIKNQEKNEKKE